MITLDLNTKLEKIKKLIFTSNYDMIDKGITLAREVNEPIIFDILLKNCRYDEQNYVDLKDEFNTRAIQPLIRNKLFTGTLNTQPYLDYALLNLIGYCSGKDIDKTIQKKYITRIFLPLISFSKFPMGLLELKELKEFYISSKSENNALPIPHGIDKLSKLEILQWSCNIKEIPKTIVNLKNLEKLLLYDNQIECLPEYIFQMNNLQIFCIENNNIKSLPLSISNLNNLMDNDPQNSGECGLTIHMNPFMDELLINIVANGLENLDGFIGEKTDFKQIMGQTLYYWMNNNYGKNNEYYFIDIPYEPIDDYDGDTVIYGPLAATSKNADTPNYILRAISMFFREKEDLGKTLLDNPNCPLGVLYDVIRGDNDKLKEVAAKSPAFKKLKPAGFGRYADPDTGEVIAKMQDGKLVAI